MIRSSILLVALALSNVGATQRPTPPADHIPKGPVSAPGSIRGRITSADNGRPLRRATVSLRADTAQASRPLLSVSTNSQGVFEMRDVPPGSYFVSAARAGYIEVQYGQRRPRERGLAVEVRSGEVRDRVDVALPRGAVIVGRIVDELGAAYPGVNVTLLEGRYQLGERTYFPAAVATTDDRGEYRLSGLQPGRYYLLANSSETWRNEKNERFGYATTFFAGAPTLDRAVPITVGIGDERPNSDLTLIASRTSRIRGRVQRPTGDPLGGEAVALNRSAGIGFLVAGGRQTRTAADGTFEFDDVSPATYTVRATSSGASASTLVTISGADVDNVVLVPRTGSTVIGTIVTDRGEPPPFRASGVRVTLISPPGAEVLPTVRVIEAADNWMVQMRNLGGPFVFRINGLPEGWMLDAVRLGEKEISEAPYEVPTGGVEITDLQLVVTQSVGTITGAVATVDGKPTVDATIVVFADDASLWTVASRYVRSTRPSADGTFKIAALPAGTYLAIAREFVVDGEWETKEFLEAARRDAVRVTLSRGATESIALKVR